MAEENKIGFDIVNGASRNMNQQAKEYGRMARNKIVKIASLMIKNGVNLDANNYKDGCKFIGKGKDPKRELPSGILGW